MQASSNGLERYLFGARFEVSLMYWSSIQQSCLTRAHLTAPLSCLDSFGGIAIIAPVSLGNHQFVASSRLMRISAVVLVLLTLFGVTLAADIGIQTAEFWRNELEKPKYHFVLMVYYIAGALLGFEIFRGWVAGVIPRKLVRQFAVLRFFFLPRDIRRSYQIKQAGTHKINALIENAHKLHRRAQSKAGGQKMNDMTMLAFHLHGEKTEGCGGFVWTLWRTLWNDHIATKEGVWIHSKFVVGQYLQAAVTIFLVYFWIYGTEEVAESAENERASIKEGPDIVPNWQGPYEDLVELHLRFIPENWM